jgi:hypothetical protein
MKEIKIYCDKDGWADRTEVVQHDESHQLIEEFMLLANESVATALDKASVPHVNRVHDDPDPEKLAALREELAGNGFKVGDLTHRSEMVKLLASLQGPGGRLRDPHPAPALAQAGLLPPVARRTLRPGETALLALHVADPALLRPPGAPHLRRLHPEARRAFRPQGAAALPGPRRADALLRAHLDHRTQQLRGRARLGEDQASSSSSSARPPARTNVRSRRRSPT